MESPDERILLVWLAATLAVASALGLAVGVVDRLYVGVGVWLGPAAFVAATFGGSLYAAARFRNYRFECRHDVLYLERGVLTRVRTVVPLAYVRRVDVRDGPVERLVGIRRLVVYADGAQDATVTIPGLTVDRASRLQDRLRSGPERPEIAVEPRSQ